MQSERITFLTTPEAKAAIMAKAAKRGISTGEYIRLAVDNLPEETAEEEELAALIGELAAAVPEMQDSLRRTAQRMEDTVAEVDRMLREAESANEHDRRRDEGHQADPAPSGRTSADWMRPARFKARSSRSSPAT